MWITLAPNGVLPKTSTVLCCAEFRLATAQYCVRTYRPVDCIKHRQLLVKEFLFVTFSFLMDVVSILEIWLSAYDLMIVKNDVRNY